MKFNDWSLAANITTMMVAILGLFAAITYYFSLFDLETKYYFSTYFVLATFIIFVFFSVLYQPKKEGLNDRKKRND